MKSVTVAFIALLAAVALFSGPAGAKPLIVGASYEDEISRVGSCGSVDNCTLTFSRVQAGNDLLINRVSCNLLAQGSTQVVKVRVAATKGGDVLPGRIEWVIPQRVFTNGSNTNYAVNDEAPLLVRGTQNPAIIVSISPAGSISPECRIYGQITPQP
jgi:hypothetical protein